MSQQWDGAVATSHSPSWPSVSLSRLICAGKLDVSVSFILKWYHLLLSSFSFPVTPGNLFSLLNLSIITVCLPPWAVMLRLWVHGVNTQVAQKHGEMIEHNFDSSVLFSTERICYCSGWTRVSAFKKMPFEHIGSMNMLTYWDEVLWLFLKSYLFFLKAGE